MESSPGGRAGGILVVTVPEALELSKRSTPIDACALCSKRTQKESNEWTEVGVSRPQVGCGLLVVMHATNQGSARAKPRSIVKPARMTRSENLRL